MNYNRSEIMKAAWVIVRRFEGSREPLRSVLSRSLSYAWSEAKRAARLAAEAEAMRKALEGHSADYLQTQIHILESKDFFAASDYARLSELRRALHVAQAREQAEAEEADLANKRSLIASAKGRFCSVTFTKKDGTERVMRVQPASLRLHVSGDAATEAGRKAAATRAARHPHLLPVWDAEARAARSINLATVSRIKVNGEAHLF